MRPGFILTSELLASITSAEGTVAFDHENNYAKAHMFYAPLRAYVFRVTDVRDSDTWAAVCLNGMRVTEFKVFRAGDRRIENVVAHGARGSAMSWLTVRLDLLGEIPYTRTAAFAPLTEAQTVAAGRRF